MILIKILNSLAVQQSTTSDKTNKIIQHFLEYVATHSDYKIRYFDSDILLAVYSDTSNVSELK